jgi:hypothetical protein
MQVDEIKVNLQAPGDARFISSETRISSLTGSGDRLRNAVPPGASLWLP